MPLYSLQFDASICAACPTSDCLVKCQYMKVDKETARNEMLKIAKGEDSFVLRDCLTCYSCEEYCRFGNHPFYLISEKREEKGILTAPRPLANQWIYMTEPKDQHELEGQYEVGEVRETAISLCAMEDLKKIVKGRMFENLASSYILGLEFFCNLVHLHFAKPSAIKERLPRTIGNIAQLGIKKLICVHDECFGAFTSFAHAYGIDVPFEPIHYFQYLYERLLELKGEIQPLNIRAVYQRNCSARLSPSTDHFVNDIFELIGVELVQRTYQEENALCCGGVMNDIAGPEKGLGVRDRNLDDIAGSGAEYCIFNCPACMMVMAEKLYKRGIIPFHMIDLCNAAVGGTQ